MGIIHVLPDRIANQIAAGEVVERPASVVKELLENALDAAATRIHIEVVGGGRRRIRLMDDGCGMIRDDALLAFERHATSKLRNAEDLLSVATLGFRGEALPSLAAVARLTLETSARGANAGTRLEIVGGKLRSVAEVGLPSGTAVAVDDLFFNLPARRKFLKTEATELGHIVTLVTHYALAYPEIQFSLDTPQRTIFSLAPAPNSRERMRQLFGDELLESLVEFAEQAQLPPYPDEVAPETEVASVADIVSPPSLGIFGFISRPELQKLNRNSIFTFVNRRLVRDRLIQHAISEAYRNLLPNHAYPVVLLFLELPFTEVDVNVHPAKVEVRFRRQGFIHDAVRDSLRRVLSGARPIPSLAREVRARATASRALTPDSASAPAMPSAAPIPSLESDLVAAFRLTPDLLPPAPRSLPFANAGEEAVLTPLPDSALAHALARHASGACDSRTLASDGWLPEGNSGSAPGAEIGSLQPLGQVRDSFIVAAGTTGMYLVDQHAAHERILFERLQDQIQSRQVQVQSLLLPAVIRLDPGRFLLFAEIAPIVHRAGFEIEPFSQNSLAVKAVPAGFPPDAIESMLVELLDGDGAEMCQTPMETRLQRMIATVACHSAIKVNMHLEPEKMQWLMQNLAAAQFPMTCPHGRPVLLHFSLREIQMAFKRVR